MEELFIYIGYSNRTHFYIHNIYNTNTKNEEILRTNIELYNFMINEMMIQKNEKIFVINLGKDNSLLTVSVNHSLFDKVIYDNEKLDYILHELRELKHDNLMVIKYDEESDFYEYYETDKKNLDYKIPKTLLNSEIVYKESDIPINNLINCF